MSAQNIMTKLEDLKERYLDENGRHLLIGGLDSYLTPEKYAALAEKYKFEKYKSLHIDDEQLLDEVKGFIEHNKMVAVAAWTKEGRVDLYIEPTYQTIQTKSEIALLENLQDNFLVLNLRGQNEVFALAFSPSGQLLAIGNQKSVQLWDIAGKRIIKRLEAPMHWEGDWVLSIAFSSNGQLVAAGCADNEAYVWDVSTGNRKLQLKDSTQTWRKFPRDAYSAIYNITFSPDGSLLAGRSGGTGHILFWEISNGRQVRRIENDSSGLSMAFSPDGRLVAADKRGNLVLWEAKSGTEILSIKFESGGFIEHILFSPDGNLIAAAAATNPIIRLWDVASGKEVQKMEGHTDKVFCLAFNPNGQLLASGGEDQTIRLWDIKSGRELAKLVGHSNKIRAVAFSPKGEFLATGSWDKTVRLWRLSNNGDIDDSKSQREKGCFVATEVYGSPSAEQVILFRKFRDRVLSKSRVGCILVTSYYRISPFVANLISKRVVVKLVIRSLLLEPILWIVKGIMHLYDRD